ncbi:MAG: hypothetical protein G01um101470_1045 [Parcubacteria group bacterium Gr01-1014_70]|nr:MAG: hypothetical protein G01um101470_1045 [Parcubacteria group bacterium Gr01-1014_70]
MLIGASLIFFFGAFVLGTNANHAWNGFHWGRTANPFTLELGDNVSSTWDGYLATTASDWSVSAVLDTLVKAGKTNSRACKATSGRAEVCSYRYGFNGWLGVAQVWISGEHIVKGTVKVNDSYFNTSTYNTPAWRNLVMCQEVGHILGLDHQDETFDNPNLDTCMDYTNDPSTNQHPNQHDYDQLEAIYAHLDGVNTILAFSNEKGGNGRGKPAEAGHDINLDDPSAWGQAIRQDAEGKNSLFVRHLGGNEKVFTFVIWTQE